MPIIKNTESFAYSEGSEQQKPKENYKEKAKVLAQSYATKIAQMTPTVYALAKKYPQRAGELMGILENMKGWTNRIQKISESQLNAQRIASMRKALQSLEASFRAKRVQVYERSLQQTRKEEKNKVEKAKKEALQTQKIVLQQKKLAEKKLQGMDKKESYIQIKQQYEAKQQKLQEIAADPDAAPYAVEALSKQLAGMKQVLDKKDSELTNDTVKKMLVSNKKGLEYVSRYTEMKTTYAANEQLLRDLEGKQDEASRQMRKRLEKKGRELQNKLYLAESLMKTGDFLVSKDLKPHGKTYEEFSKQITTGVLQVHDEIHSDTYDKSLKMTKESVAWIQKTENQKEVAKTVAMVGTGIVTGVVIATAAPLVLPVMGISSVVATGVLAVAAEGVATTAVNHVAMAAIESAYAKEGEGYKEFMKFINDRPPEDILQELALNTAGAGVFKAVGPMGKLLANKVAFSSLKNTELKVVAEELLEAARKTVKDPTALSGIEKRVAAMKQLSGKNLRREVKLLMTAMGKGRETEKLSSVTIEALKKKLPIKAVALAGALTAEYGAFFALEGTMRAASQYAKTGTLGMPTKEEWQHMALNSMQSMLMMKAMGKSMEVAGKKGIVLPVTSCLALLKRINASPAMSAIQKQKMQMLVGGMLSRVAKAVKEKNVDAYVKELQAMLGVQKQWELAIAGHGIPMRGSLTVPRATVGTSVSKGAKETTTTPAKKLMKRYIEKNNEVETRLLQMKIHDAKKGTEVTPLKQEKTEVFQFTKEEVRKNYELPDAQRKDAFLHLLTQMGFPKREYHPRLEEGLLLAHKQPMTREGMMNRRIILAQYGLTKAETKLALESGVCGMADIWKATKGVVSVLFDDTYFLDETVDAVSDMSDIYLLHTLSDEKINISARKFHINENNTLYIAGKDNPRPFKEGTGKGTWNKDWVTVQDKDITTLIDNINHLGSSEKSKVAEYLKAKFTKQLDTLADYSISIKVQIDNVTSAASQTLKDVPLKEIGVLDPTISSQKITDVIYDKKYESVDFWENYVKADKGLVKNIAEYFRIKGQFKKLDPSSEAIPAPAETSPRRVDEDGYEIIEAEDISLHNVADDLDWNDSTMSPKDNEAQKSSQENKKNVEENEEVLDIAHEEKSDRADVSLAQEEGLKRGDNNVLKQQLSGSTGLPKNFMKKDQGVLDRMNTIKKEQQIITEKKKTLVEMEHDVVDLKSNLVKLDLTDPDSASVARASIAKKEEDMVLLQKEINTRIADKDFLGEELGKYIDDHRLNITTGLPKNFMKKDQGVLDRMNTINKEQQIITEKKKTLVEMEHEVVELKSNLVKLDLTDPDSASAARASIAKKEENMVLLKEEISTLVTHKDFLGEELGKYIDDHRLNITTGLPKNFMKKDQGVLDRMNTIKKEQQIIAEKEQALGDMEHEVVELKSNLVKLDLTDPDSASAARASIAKKEEDMVLLQKEINTRIAHKDFLGEELGKYIDDHRLIVSKNLENIEENIHIGGQKPMSFFKRGAIATAAGLTGGAIGMKGLSAFLDSQANAAEKTQESANEDQKNRYEEELQRRKDVLTEAKVDKKMLEQVEQAQLLDAVLGNTLLTEVKEKALVLTTDPAEIKAIQDAFDALPKGTQQATDAAKRTVFLQTVVGLMGGKEGFYDTQTLIHAENLWRQRMNHDSGSSNIRVLPASKKGWPLIRYNPKKT